MTAAAQFNRHTYAAMLADVFSKTQRCNSHIITGPRNDLFAKHRDPPLLKIGGSAYRLVRDRAYHHGTVLYDSQLVPLIPRLLQGDARISQSRATPSVSSPVGNLGGGLSWAEMVELVAARYGQMHPECKLAELADRSAVLALAPEIATIAAELHSWQWTYGRTPAFRVNDALIENGLDSAGARYDGLHAIVENTPHQTKLHPTGDRRGAATLAKPPLAASPRGSTPC